MSGELPAETAHSLLDCAVDGQHIEIEMVRRSDAPAPVVWLCLSDDFNEEAVSASLTAAEARLVGGKLIAGADALERGWPNAE